jgi:hypothetical protein
MNKVQEALEAAIEYIESTDYEKRAIDVLKLCKSALSEIGKCEPVAWVYAEDIKQLCRDFSSRNGNVYIKDVESCIDSMTNTSPQYIDNSQAVGEPVETLENWLSTNMPEGTVIGDPLWWARKIRNVIAYTSPISKESTDWQYFDEAYKKATESSEPDDWMNAALMAQQVRRRMLDTSPQPIEKCEPVAEALHERNRLGYAVVDVIGALDEIIENAQEVEVDDFLHIAIPIDKWHELQDALEEMPKRAELYTSPQPIVKCEPDFIVKIWHDEKGKYCRNQEFVNIPEVDGVYNYYTSPQPRDWVELTNADLKDLALNTTNPDEWAKAIGAKLKQLNTKG